MMTGARRRWRWLGAVSLAGLVLGLGPSSCLFDEEYSEHCWWADGNETCREKFGDEKPYCSNDFPACGVEAAYGCVAEEPEDPACYSPCGRGVSAKSAGQCELSWGESGQGEVCGDGVIEGLEECDDGNSDNSDACLDTCEAARCGDGVIYMGVEACDDGNSDNTDACLASCVHASCGDGSVRAGVELCDDGNSDNSDACLDTCEPASCGDGSVWEGVEACDDGNAVNSDACLDTCEPASCGDGFVQESSEECDDGDSDNTDVCPETCVSAYCGDGFVWAGVEQCDDGDADDLNACSNSCTLNP